MYKASSLATFLPFWFVATSFFVFCFVFLSALAYVSGDTQRFLTALLIFLPMSALPFIILGMPLGVINRVFICRSSVVFLIIFFFFKMIADKSPYFKCLGAPPLMGSVCFLFLSYFLSFLGLEGGHFLDVGKSILVLLSCVLFFYILISYIDSEQKIKYIFNVLLIACVLQAFLSGLSYFYYIAIKHKSIIRAEGFFRDYEIFAEYLALHIPLFFYMIRSQKKKKYKRLLLGFLTVVLFVLLSTGTRGVIISTVLGLGYYFFMLRKKINFISGLKMFGGGLFSCSIALFLLYKFLPPAANILERFGKFQINSLNTRGPIWADFFYYFKQKPIMGHGAIYDLWSYLSWPHSTYFSYLLMAGIIGLLAYLIFLSGILKKGFLNVRYSRDNSNFFEPSVLLNTILIIFIVDSAKIDYQRYSNYQLFIWMIFALIVSWNRILLKKKVTNENIVDK